MGALESAYWRDGGAKWHQPMAPRVTYIRTKLSYDHRFFRRQSRNRCAKRRHRLPPCCQIGIKTTAHNGMQGIKRRGVA